MILCKNDFDSLYSHEKVTLWVLRTDLYLLLTKIISESKCNQMWLWKNENIITQVGEGRRLLRPRLAEPYCSWDSKCQKFCNFLFKNSRLWAFKDGKNGKICWFLSPQSVHTVNSMFALSWQRKATFWDAKNIKLRC